MFIQFDELCNFKYPNLFIPVIHHVFFITQICILSLLNLHLKKKKTSFAHFEDLIFFFFFSKK